MRKKNVNIIRWVIRSKPCLYPYLQIGNNGENDGGELNVFTLFKTNNWHEMKFSVNSYAIRLYW